MARITRLVVEVTKEDLVNHGGDYSPEEVAAYAIRGQFPKVLCTNKHENILTHTMEITFKVET